MQRDLFLDYVPPEAEVFAFPLARRAGAIRSIARQLLRCQSQVHADRLWRLECRKLEAELANRATGAEEIRAQLEAYRAAVENEIANMRPQSRPGGGAA